MQSHARLKLSVRRRDSEVPYFRVRLEATNIHVADLDEGGSPVIGFFTTRLVRAKTVDEAEAKAKGMVLLDWTVGEFASANRGGEPVLNVEAVYTASWWQWLRYKNKGHAFYRAEDPAEQAVQPDRA